MTDTQWSCFTRGTVCGLWILLADHRQRECTEDVASEVILGPWWRIPNVGPADKCLEPVSEALWK